ncbi:hypothetical protein CEXT_120731 [Caerostris extrusa]|uniref:Uncharacterized protein n=1 Tax=Caerostris extrusa TaxID=172846 RepID=A0AAV4PM80_CAEEX|nr:hypothetical protein CEXT_120731 [Caerostris extrusa]
MPKPMLQRRLPVPRPLPESQPGDQCKLPLTKEPSLEEKCMDKTSHTFKRKSIRSPQPNIRSEDPRTDLEIGSHSKIQNSILLFHLSLHPKDVSSPEEG